MTREFVIGNKLSSRREAGDMDGDARIQAMENPPGQGMRLVDNDNHGESMGRVVARRATSFLLFAGVVATLVYESTERKQAPLPDFQSRLHL